MAHQRQRHEHHLRHVDGQPARRRRRRHLPRRQPGLDPRAGLRRTRRGVHPGVVTNPGTGSPNRLLYVGPGGTTPPPGKKFENTTGYAINDNATVEAPVTVTGVTGNAPAALSVPVNISHTYIGDLKIDLVAPDGSVYNLKAYGSGGSGDNVVTTYTVNASSEVANGTWKLRVGDNANADTGRINSWALQF